MLVSWIGHFILMCMGLFDSLIETHTKDECIWYGSALLCQCVVISLEIIFASFFVSFRWWLRQTIFYFFQHSECFVNESSLWLHDERRNVTFLSLLFVTFVVLLACSCDIVWVSVRHGHPYCVMLMQFLVNRGVFFFHTWITWTYWWQHLIKSRSFFKLKWLLCVACKCYLQAYCLN